MISATRYHDFAAGHRIVGHESKCRNLHGHGYRVHFTCICTHGLDPLGRVIDFGVIKSRLCEWLEQEWDHRLLLWDCDPWLPTIKELDHAVIAVPFNPSAENMAAYLLQRIGPRQLEGTGVTLKRVIVEETRKCSAMAER
jgi:6-pyruvoyltetrahydropterin/6-carboxytetrahydropterin synthase